MASVFTMSGCRAQFLPVATLFLLLILSNGPALAGSYSCGNPTGGGHCYGIVTWQEQPQYYGVYANVDQSGMGCPSGCDGEINNEVWLQDDQTAGCTSNKYGRCWVEAGFHASSGDATGGYPFYFWADARPMNSNTYNVHLLADAYENDLKHVMIIKDAREAPGIFQVWIYNDSHSTLFNGTSTRNPMSGNSIAIGAELAGSTGAFGSAQFGWNIWAVRPLGHEFVFWYNLQSDEGELLSDSPPNATWQVAPPSHEGGLFVTSCCR
jgi:hypothetical protein